MKKLIFVLALTLAAAAHAALPDEKMLLAIGRAAGDGFGELKVKPEEAARAAAGLRDYLTIKDNFPAQEASAKAHELIAARQEAAGGNDAPGQGTQEQWLAGLYAYGQETGAQLYAGSYSKEEAAALARGFEEALCGRAPKLTGQERRDIAAFMAARAKKSAAAQAAFFEKMAREPGAVKTASGGLFIPRKEGTGQAPKPYYWVKAVVSVKLWDGKPQGEADNGEKEMQLPEAGFITDAFMLMKTGGKATLVTPARPGSGDMPAGVIEVELLSVRQGAKPQEPAPQPAVEEPQPPAEDAASGEKTVEDLKAEYDRTGAAAAALAIGMAYTDGTNGAAQDGKKAFIWLSRAAAKKNAVAAFHLGQAYFNGSGTPSNQAEGAKWYGRAAEWGCPEGMAAIAESYRYGWGVKRSWKDAVAWYTKAADSLNTAWNTLGDLYTFPDNDADADYAEALKWYTRAFNEAGIPDAATGAGNVYRMGGHGLEKDPAKAVDWYTKGAGRGASLSMQYLSESYAEGEGVEKNPSEAYKWYLVYMAKEPVQQAYRDQLDRLAAALTPAEKAAAGKQAEALIARLVTDKDREDKAYLETLPGK